jgi:hypothetical protein
LTDGQAKRQGRFPDDAPNLPSEAQKRRFGRFAAAGAGFEQHGDIDAQARCQNACSPWWFCNARLHRVNAAAALSGQLFGDGQCVAHRQRDGCVL